MSSRGKAENVKLRKNLEKQLDRILQDLADLEKARSDMKDDEYQESKDSLMEQLQEFNERLQRLTSGDVSLIDALSAMQLATEAAISKAFHTPEVIKMFGKKEPKQLREKLVQLERDMKLGKLSQTTGEKQKGEIVNALKQLGEKLEPTELALLEKLTLESISQTNFVEVSESEDKSTIALKLAGKEIKAAQST